MGSSINGVGVGTTVEIGEIDAVGIKGGLITYDTDETVLTVGADGTVLTADAAAAEGIKWAAAPTSSPGGADTQVQFNDSGSFGGSSLMTFAKATGVLTLSGPNSFTSPTYGLGGLADAGIGLSTSGGFDQISLIANGETCGQFSAGAGVTPSFTPVFGSTTFPAIRWSSGGQNGIYFRTTGTAGVTVTRAEANICTFGSNGILLGQLASTSHGPIIDANPAASTAAVDANPLNDIILRTVTKTLTNSGSPRANAQSVVFEAMTYAYDTAQTITEATTLTVSEPTAGVNATITDAYAIRATGRARFSSGIAAFDVNPPSAQPAKISDPTGGATIDAEARTAIDAIIDVLEGAGLSAAV